MPWLVYFTFQSVSDCIERGAREHVHTSTKLHDSVHEYGGNNEIRRYEMKNQLKQ